VQPPPDLDARSRCDRRRASEDHRSVELLRGAADRDGERQRLAKALAGAMVISFSTARPLGARHRNMKSIDLEEIGHLRADNEDTRDPEHRFGGAQRRRQAVT
jgi:hypothetical protein